MNHGVSSFSGQSSGSFAAYVFPNVTTIPPTGYATYDNGANVFPLYCGFEGTSLSSCPSLTSEFNYIVSHINFYKWVMFKLTRKVQIIPDDDTESNIWVWRRGNDARLCYTQGYERSLRWDG